MKATNPDELAMARAKAGVHSCATREVVRAIPRKGRSKAKQKAHNLVWVRKIDECPSKSLKGKTN